jgi:hypothetical protein
MLGDGSRKTDVMECSGVGGVLLDGIASGEGGRNSARSIVEDEIAEEDIYERLSKGSSSSSSRKARSMLVCRMGGVRPRWRFCACGVDNARRLDGATATVTEGTGLERRGTGRLGGIAISLFLKERLCVAIFRG